MVVTLAKFDKASCYGWYNLRGYFEGTAQHDTSTVQRVVELYRISCLCSGREGRGLHFPVVLQLFPPYSLQNLALLNLSLSSFYKKGLISDFSPLFEYLNYSVHSKQPQKYIYFLSILVEIVARGPGNPLN